MSALLKDMFYIGRKSQVEWEREQLKTIYIIRPNEWIHCYRNDSNETIGGLFSHILQKKGITDTNPVLSYRGKPLPEEHQLNDHNKQVFILSDGLFPDHGGHMWSCGHCKNPKTGLMQGSLRKTQFEKECTQKFGAATDYLKFIVFFFPLDKSSLHWCQYKLNYNFQFSSGGLLYTG